MKRVYKLDAGYVTIPEAAKIVKQRLGIQNEMDHYYYNKILRHAKRGWFGGKMHGKRMFQVRRQDIFDYANEILENENYNLFTYERYYLATCHNEEPFKVNETSQ